ncbi:MAG: class I SAM-dependent methyltransferase [Candidatus Latescibacteria bacterium]|nr:class I SAM-dependent methyltransferase [Candidatus Latescibacterota bacterium]
MTDYRGKVYETGDLDYDSDPDRFRSSVAAVAKYGLMGDVHPEVAERMSRENLKLVLDVGCGEGRFSNAALAWGLSTIGLDQSDTMLAAVASPRIKGDAMRLPFRDGCFDGLVALWMLYNVATPTDTISEAFRVLRPGGLFVACAPSRFNDPELSEVLPSSSSGFDAENGVAQIEKIFRIVDVSRWDAPLIHLPDNKALAMYLRGRGLSEHEIERAREIIPLPITITKRGALMTARKVD